MIGGVLLNLDVFFYFYWLWWFNLWWINAKVLGWITWRPVLILLVLGCASKLFLKLFRQNHFLQNFIRIFTFYLHFFSGISIKQIPDHLPNNRKCCWTIKAINDSAHAFVLCLKSGNHRFDHAIRHVPYSKVQTVNHHYEIFYSTGDLHVFAHEFYHKNDKINQFLVSDILRKL